MSFLINGIGYHILVQALPVQVAQQTSLTSFVLRAVGMMYLVDMDDTPGYKLTVVLPPSPKTTDGPEQSEEPSTTTSGTKKNERPRPPAYSMHGASSYDIYKSTQEIIEDAKNKLDALTTNPHEMPVNFNTSVRESLFGSFVVRPTKGQLREQAFYGKLLKDVPTASLTDTDLELGHSLSRR
jgi:hypothetical protein